jgi:hypothetical protein
MSIDTTPKLIPEAIWCHNSGCLCKQTNYDNHPEGKAPPTNIYHYPEKTENTTGWRSKHAWFHLCWELGIKEPFDADELVVQALAINVIRMLREENYELHQLALKGAGDDELVCVWPDDTYCLMEDLEEYLSSPCAMSDDYEVHHIDSNRAKALIGE